MSIAAKQTQEINTHANNNTQTLTRDQVVHEFNKAIFSLLKFLDGKRPNSSISRIINLMKIAKQIDHEVLIKEAGPYLYKYREMIRQRNIEAFSEASLKQEIEKKQAASEEKNDAYANLAMDTFSMLYKLKAELSAEDYKFVYGVSDNLLLRYLDYCVECRKGHKK